MNAVLRLLVAATIAAPHAAMSQSPSAPKPRESGIYLTIFRSPSTGVEIRSGHAALNVGFYPTILSKNGTRGNVNFIRVGGTYYLKARGASPYVSPSIVFSLDKNWKHGALTELGFRGTLYRTLSGRLGAGVLTTTDGQVRVNPTIGMALKIGRGR
jgi:hypothetical protein